MPDTSPAQPDVTSQLQQVRTALASTAPLTSASTETIARILMYEIADEDVPLFTLLVEVSKAKKFWQDLLDALKGGALARPTMAPSPKEEG